MKMATLGAAGWACSAALRTLDERGDALEVEAVQQGGGLVGSHGLGQRLWRLRVAGARRAVAWVCCRTCGSAACTARTGLCLRTCASDGALACCRSAAAAASSTTSDSRACASASASDAVTRSGSGVGSSGSSSSSCCCCCCCSASSCASPASRDGGDVSPLARPPLPLGGAGAGACWEASMERY